LFSTTTCAVSFDTAVNWSGKISTLHRFVFVLFSIQKFKQWADFMTALAAPKLQPEKANLVALRN
jgi:hypothetical protein